MQKIGQERRFWWRALEAPTSEPLLSDTERYADGPAPMRSAALPLDDFTPTIPASDAGPMMSLPGERRRLASRRRWSVRQRGLLVMSLVAVSGATALVGAVLADRNTRASLDRQAMGLFRHSAVTAGFGIGQVSLTGHRYAADDDVFNALDLENVRTFWDLDAAAAVDRIERIPWVDKAEITRLFPNALRIDIRERVPSLIWSRGDQDYLIDNSGRVLASLEAGHHWRLPRVVGEGANIELAALFSALSHDAALSAAMLHAERISERRWRFVATNGTWIELGAEREAEGLREVASQPQLMAALVGPPAIVDVRTPGRVTVRPRLDSLQSASGRLARSALLDAEVAK